MSEKDGAAAMKLPGDYRLRRKGLSGATMALLTTITMLLLTVIAEPIGWQWLAWMALTPWLVAAVRAKNGGRAAMISYIGGLIYFLFNLKWLAPVTLAGYIGLCFYLGWYFVLSGYILRRIYQHREWSFTLVLPVVWVGQEYLRAAYRFSLVVSGPQPPRKHSPDAALRHLWGLRFDLSGGYGQWVVVRSAVAAFSQK